MSVTSEYSELYYSDSENPEDSEGENFQTQNRFQKRDDLSDITLVVEDKKLYVHKTLLMIHSPVFQKMLTGNFKEKCLNEIPLPGKKYSAIVGVLEQIYPGDGAHLLKDKTLQDIIKIADEYDIQQVFTNARQYMEMRLCTKCSGSRSTDSILCYLGLVESYPRLHELRKKLVEQASRIPARQMERSKYFLSIPATATRDALLRQAKKAYT